MRSLRHPGPPAAERVRAVPCRAHRLSLTLPAGSSVNEAVTGALAEAGFASGFAQLDGVAISPMRYVIPAPAPDEAHVAWYSDTRAPEGVVTVEKAAVVAGIRDGEPFIHCHGIWRAADGVRRAGHLLPHDSVVAHEARVEAWGIEGAAFVARDDPETNFKLFSAEVAAAGAAAREGGRPALACTVRPNGDISHTLEVACARNGIPEAAVHGVGSLIGVDFADGRHVPSYATEVMVASGRVAAGGAEASLDVALADMDGAVHEGVLLRGGNPVCVTFELLVVASAD